MNFMNQADEWNIEWLVFQADSSSEMLQEIFSLWKNVTKKEWISCIKTINTSRKYVIDKIPCTAVVFCVSCLLRNILTKAI